MCLQASAHELCERIKYSCTEIQKIVEKEACAQAFYSREFSFFIPQAYLVNFPTAIQTSEK